MKTILLKALYKIFAKPILFLQEPDVVHHRMLKVGRLLGSNRITKALVSSFFKYENESLEQDIAGLYFKNPVGLSAGFDKDGDLVNILEDVGFGFGQVGTVTYKAYKGNPQPWSTRLKKSKALTVYFGLKNIGVKKITERIKKFEVRREKQKRRLVKLWGEEEIPQYIASISIGKTNATYTASDDAGIKDYHDCLEYVVNEGVGDFYTINISCPNTFGGEPFTTADKLDALLSELMKVNTNKPIFLKMPINTKWKEFKKLCDVGVKHKVTGLIIGNLNKNRDDPLIKDEIPEDVNGSISGKPCEKLSNELISKTYKEYGDKLVIVGVGGIFSAKDAYEKIKRGASLVQLITGMIYEGPQLIGDINKKLVKLMKKDGFSNISEAVGSKYN